MTNNQPKNIAPTGRPLTRLVLAAAGCFATLMAQAADPTTSLPVNPKEVDPVLAIPEIYPPKTVIRRPELTGVQNPDVSGLRSSQYHGGQVIVRRCWPRRGVLKTEMNPHREATERAFDNFLRENRITIKKEYPAFDLTVLQLPAGTEPKQAIVKLRESETVEFAELDYVVSASATTPNDPSFPSQWGLHNTGQSGLGNNSTTNGPANVVGVPDRDIDAPEAWDTQRLATKCVVAVIDTGVHFTHEDLKGNMWINPGEPTINGVDNDVNGYVDDRHGICALTGSGVPSDGNGHGTHVAGTIGAETNNGLGGAGVAWDVQIMALKAFDANGFGNISTILPCLDYAIQKKADIINASWGYFGPFSNALYVAINTAQGANIPFVAAAGNAGQNIDSNPFYPAAYNLTNIVSVAATDRTGKLAYFSDFGSANVDIAAPGFDILSTDIQQGNASNINTYSSKSGTSMAAPHVSGALALMKAHCPGMNYIELIERLFSSVDIYPSLAGRCLTNGQLNLERALSCELQTVKTFCTTQPIKINDLAKASSYPSILSVSGLSATVCKVSVTLDQLTHTYPDDLDIILEGPQGQRVKLMSDAGGSLNVVNKTITFDDTVQGFHPNYGNLMSFSAPVNYAGSSNDPGDVMPVPLGNTAAVGTSLSVFNNLTPNGLWKLYIYDDEGLDVGTLKRWCLNFTLCCPAHLLLTHNTQGYAVVADMDQSDNWTALRAWGPYPGWTASSVHSDPSANNRKRILWSHPSGWAVLWRFDSNWSNSSFGYNVYLNPGFLANSYQRTPNGAKADILWSNPSTGTVMLHGLTGLDAPWYPPSNSIQKNFPLGWVGTSLQRYQSTGYPGKLLLTNSLGEAQIHNVGTSISTNPLPGNIYRPFPGWAAHSYNLDAHNKCRILWTATDFRHAWWNMSAPANAAAPVGSFINDLVRGPYQNWHATSYFR